jgi:hypothetical protein
VAKRSSVSFDRESGTFKGLDTSAMLELKEAFSNVDVDEEFMKMSIWLQSPRGKRRQGNINFILNWLNRAPASYKEEPVKSYLPSDHVRDYLERLWMGKEQLFRFNTLQ